MRKKWQKSGFEVHQSKDGIEWYRVPGPTRRPAFETLSEAREAYRKAVPNYRHVRLIALRMDYELLEKTETPETVDERKAKICAAAKEALKEDRSVWVTECSYMSMESLELSRTYVMVQTHQHLLGVGPSPRRPQFPQGDEGKAQYKQAVKDWDAKAKVLDDEKAKWIKQKLTAAGIKFKQGRQYGWNVFNLA